MVWFLEYNGKIRLKFAVLVSDFIFGKVSDFCNFFVSVQVQDIKFFRGICCCRVVMGNYIYFNLKVMVKKYINIIKIINYFQLWKRIKRKEDIDV